MSVGFLPNGQMEHTYQLGSHSRNILAEYLPGAVEPEVRVQKEVEADSPDRQLNLLQGSTNKQRVGRAFQVAAKMLVLCGLSMCETSKT